MLKFLLISVIALLAPLEGGGVMLIAHRNGMAVSGWTNPYVADGLIAMWDGIWNVGGGQPHDSDSLIWWDCVGGLLICPTWNSSVFLSDGLSVDTNSMLVGVLSNRALEDFGFRSVEIVLGVGGTTQVTSVICFGPRTVSLKTAVSGIGFFRSGNYMTRTGLDMSVATKFSAYADYGDTTSYNASEVLIDGQATSVAGSDGWGVNDGVGFGKIKSGYGASNGYPFTGTIHAIRLYSRALTAEEIARNYAKDKERFNLP